MTRPTKNFGPTAQRIRDFIIDHPGCTKNEIMQGVYGGIRAPSTIKAHMHRLARQPDLKLKRKSVYWIEK